MKKRAPAKAVYRKEYSPYPWTLENVVLSFEIGEESTRVLSRFQISRNEAVSAVTDIELDGQ